MTLRALRLRGFVLLSTLGVVTFLMLVGVSLFTRGIWQSTAATRTYERSNALYLAEAGVDQAARNLRTADPVDDVGVSPEWAGLPSGRFTVAPPFAVTGSLYQVRTTGESGSKQRELEVILQLTPQSVFQYALFGDRGMSVNGSAITDSYDSTEGVYDPVRAGHEGDIGTNATAVGSVMIDGGIFIDGQVTVGYGAPDPAGVVTDFLGEPYDPGLITGGTSPPSDTQDVIAQESLFPMPMVSPPAGLPCPDEMINAFEVEVLPAGTYCFRDLTIGGHGVLTASGPVTVYIVGEFTARGDSIVGVQSNPEQMLFLMSPTAEGHLGPEEGGAFGGDTKFYGAMYAPDSPITISGNTIEIYGSLIGKSVDVRGNASIHYDESLRDLNTGPTNTFSTTQVAWRELLP